jgi:hypothetical protein
MCSHTVRAMLKSHYIQLYFTTMSEVVEIPLELTSFYLPEAVKFRLQFLLDQQDAGNILTLPEQQEAAGLVELAEFLSLLRLRANRIIKQ